MCKVCQCTPSTRLTLHLYVVACELREPEEEILVYIFLNMNFTPSARQVLALMVFWGQIQNYMMRVNLSILIVAMVKDNTTAQNVDSNSTSIQVNSNLTCMENRVDSFNQSELRNPDHHQGFDWNELRRGQVLGAFSIGYITTQVMFKIQC